MDNPLINHDDIHHDQESQDEIMKKITEEKLFAAANDAANQHQEFYHGSAGSDGSDVEQSDAEDDSISSSSGDDSSSYEDDEEEDDDEEYEDDDESDDDDTEDQSDESNDHCHFDDLEEFQQQFTQSSSFSLSLRLKGATLPSPTTSLSSSSSSLKLVTCDFISDDEDEEDSETASLNVELVDALRSTAQQLSVGGNVKLHTPWWFNNEDESHIKAILQAYADHLELDAHNRAVIRAPKSFIGRVHRRIVINDHATFKTIDTVKVYQWTLQPIGLPLDPSRDNYVILTTWDRESGMPTHFETQAVHSMQRYWHDTQSMCSKQMLQQGQSFLFCSPVFDSRDQYRFWVDSVKYPIEYLVGRSTRHPSIQPRFPLLCHSSNIYSHSLIPHLKISSSSTCSDDINDCVTA
ncbi:hypothetical protein SAMD00019534_105930, partial [Acytostelium subglobosum LB1]|uniref:hypothetical protein n=1 Tax=Acytostelium subglobosum LB1 TaxID=1410327 RepID=UPI0006450F09